MPTATTPLPKHPRPSPIPPPPRSAIRPRTSASTLRRESDAEYDTTSGSDVVRHRQQQLQPQRPLTEPTSPKLPYFDKYPRRRTESPKQLGKEVTVVDASQRRDTSLAPSRPPRPSREKHIKDLHRFQQSELYAWPSVSTDDVGAVSSSTSSSSIRKPYDTPPSTASTLRVRNKSPSLTSTNPRTSPQYNNTYHRATDVEQHHSQPFIRSSTSSMYTQTTLNDYEADTPPRTPTPTSTPPPDGILVASGGVETMDALVDQMNGGHDADSDFFPSMMKRSSRKDKSSSTATKESALAMRHHPLYHPPLPVPPEGVKLGAKGAPIPAITDDDSNTSPKRHARKPSLSKASSSSRPSTQAHRAPVRSTSEATLKTPSSRSKPLPDLADGSPYRASSRPRTTSRGDRDREPRRDRSRHKEREREREKDKERDYRTPSRDRHRAESSTRRSIGGAKEFRQYADVHTPPPAPPLPPKREPIVVPSIGDIIRTHAPNLARPKLGARIEHPPSSFVLSPITQMMIEEKAKVVQEEEEETMTNRSSMDSIAAEVQDTLKRTPRPANTTSRSLHHAKSFGDRPRSVPSKDQPSFGSVFGPGGALRAPASEGGQQQYYNDAGSTYSGTTGLGYTLFPPTNGTPPAQLPTSPTQEIAQFLRSPRLTRLMTLRRHPNAGLQVSLADVGSSTGHPVMVYLGLGCVRYLIALYDEMAEALGLRLVCIDRWGLGRTGEPKSAGNGGNGGAGNGAAGGSAGRGLLEWASVVEEVADTLDLKEYSVLAHSAGAPYALAGCLKMGGRVKGSIHLLAPWVSMSVDGGYKWLKYVPNGLIKTAQAAEWKVQGWMLGKPPTVTHQAIGFDATAAAAQSPPALPPITPEHLNQSQINVLSPTPNQSQSHIPSTSSPHQTPTQLYAQSKSLEQDRMSTGTSEYDDLADFQGRFGSTTTLPSTLGMTSPSDNRSVKGKTNGSPLDHRSKKKPKTFIAMFGGTGEGFRSTSGSRANSVTSAKSPPQAAKSHASSSSKPPTIKSPKLKGLKSFGSLKNGGNYIQSNNASRSSDVGSFAPTPPSLGRRGSEPAGSPVLSLADLPPVPTYGLGLGIGSMQGSSGNGRMPPSPNEWGVLTSNTGSGSGSSVFEAQRRPHTSGTVQISRASSSTSIDLPRPRRSLSLTSPMVASPSPAPNGSRHVPSALPFPNYETSVLSSSTPSSPYYSSPPSWNPAVPPANPNPSKGSTMTLASALLRASHAESLKGGTADLLAILERDSRPWGFSYGDVKHSVKVWYGDRDEKIAVSSVRWMERVMRDCKVKIVKGGGHGLMTNAEVMVEVLESIAREWGREDHISFSPSPSGVNSNPVSPLMREGW